MSERAERAGRAGRSEGFEGFLRDVRRRVLPHAELSVVERLWRERLYRKLANYLWVQFLMGRGATRMWGGHPYWLTLDPSNFCQLHCPFCPTGANKGTRNKAMMDFDHFKKFMDRVGPYVIRMELMNWGESLFNRRLPDMIAEAKRHGISLELHENFNHVSEETVEKLVRSGLDVISISVDGLTQETYERYRVGGRLESVLANLETLVRKRHELASPTPRIIWQFLVFRHNEHEVDRVEEFARARGADDVRIKPPYLPTDEPFLAAWMPRDPRFQLYPVPPGPEPEGPAPMPNKGVRSSQALRVRRFRPTQILRSAYLRDLLAMIDSPADAARAAGMVGRALVQWIRPESVEGHALIRARPGDTPGFCEWPWAGMTINPEGSVSPCCAIEDQADDFGNVFAERWSALWNGRSYRTARRHVRRFSRGKATIRTDSDHPCVRCTVIGNIRFDLNATRPSA
ncbi:MAG: radical SAM protein [Deltaproteobacteria bacterium]|nr:radical SAM protein [Deltaproteobacteria bacterium]